jgi:hypothetical protein
MPLCLRFIGAGLEKSQWTRAQTVERSSCDGHPGVKGFWVLTVLEVAEESLVDIRADFGSGDPQSCEDLMFLDGQLSGQRDRASKALSGPRQIGPSSPSGFEGSRLIRQSHVSRSESGSKRPTDAARAD